MRKQQDDGVGVGPSEVKVRDHDEGFDLLDAVAEDLLAAVERKDKGRLKAALEAFCSYVQDQDEIQDNATMGAQK